MDKLNALTLDIQIQMDKLNALTLDIQIQICCLD